MKDTVTYQPTLADKERVKIKPGQLLLSGDGVFATRQGEGATAGKEAVFVRLHLCNLACGRGGGWVCDTRYTWDKSLPEFWQEPVSVEIEDLAAEVEEKWNLKWGSEGYAQKRVILTGGEPLLQQRMAAKLLNQLPNYSAEFETNGTIAPIEEISWAQFNCSPKLENSGNGQARRYRPDALKVIAKLPNSYFKFVVTSKMDFREIDQIVSSSGILPNRVLIMPEGRDADMITQKATEYGPLAVERGYLITKRLQLEWYGDTRAT